MSPKEKLLNLMRGDAPVIAPSAWNAISAKMIQAMGFKMSFLTGGGITESLLGMPDIGSITMSEMVTQVKYICMAAQVPVIADGNSGFGNALNAMRTVTEMEIAGAAGVAIEDRITPPYHHRSPSADSAGTPELFPFDVAVKKIAASVRGIRKGEILVAGRSDSGKIDESIARGRAFVKAGAEMFFPHGTPSSFTSKDVRHIAESVGVPAIVNLPLLRSEKGKPPSASDFRGSLAKVVIFPREIVNAGLVGSAKALRQIMGGGKSLKVSHELSPELADLPGYTEFFRQSKLYLPSPD